MISALIVLTLVLVGINCTTASAFAHTSAYWTGFNQGKLDRKIGIPETQVDMCQSSDLAGGKDLEHCVIGYLDGLNGRAPWQFYFYLLAHLATNPLLSLLGIYFSIKSLNCESDHDLFVYS
jgi:hypothetical protein